MYVFWKDATRGYRARRALEDEQIRQEKRDKRNAEMAAQNNGDINRGLDNLDRVGTVNDEENGDREGNTGRALNGSF